MRIGIATMAIVAARADGRGGLYGVVGTLAGTVCLARGAARSCAVGGVARRHMRPGMIGGDNDGGLPGVRIDGGRAIPVGPTQTPGQGIFGDVVCGNGGCGRGRAGARLGIVSSGDRGIVSGGRDGVKLAGVWQVVANVDGHRGSRGVEGRGLPARMTGPRVSHRDCGGGDR